MKVKFIFIRMTLLDLTKPPRMKSLGELLKRYDKEQLYDDK